VALASRARHRCPSMAACLVAQAPRHGYTRERPPLRDGAPPALPLPRDPRQQRCGMPRVSRVGWCHWRVCTSISCAPWYTHTAPALTAWYPHVVTTHTPTAVDYPHSIPVQAQTSLHPSASEQPTHISILRSLLHAASAAQLHSVRCRPTAPPYCALHTVPVLLQRSMGSGTDHGA